MIKKCAFRVRHTVEGIEIRPRANVSHVFGKVKGATGSLLPDSGKSRQPLGVSTGPIGPVRAEWEK